MVWTNSRYISSGDINEMEKYYFDPVDRIINH